MMRDWKQNPIVVAGLLAVAALVWGVFLMRVQGGDGTVSNPHAPGSEIDTERPAATVGLPYPDVPRDPFAPFDARAVPDEEPEEQAPPRGSRIAHRLQGVIGGSALLLDPYGETHVVRRGDAVGELEILNVHAAHVEVRLNGHRLDLTLD